MKIAFVHEFLTQYGGAERVLDAFLDLWPDTPIYTLYYDAQKMGEHYGRYEIRPSILQKLPAPKPAGYKWFLPFYPAAIEGFDLRGFDIVLSDSSAFAKGVITRQPTRHLSYIHTPTRYLWSVEQEYLASAPIPAAIRPIMPPVMNYLRRWDKRAAQRPDYVIANSQTVADRIKRSYQRTVDTILFPPVDTQRFTIAKTIGDYWLIVARQEPYKRTDLAIAAATKLGIKLKVVGGGTASEDLRALAGPTIEFLGRVADADLPTLYAGAQGFIFPAEEDAGITPLESMAAGRPVLAYNKGGALESITPGLTGEFFEEQSVDGLAHALRTFKPETYDPKVIRRHAEQFDLAHFHATIQRIVKEQLHIQQEKE